MVDPVRIIPRLDLKGENLIKPIQFDGQRALGEPAEFAIFYCKQFADEILIQDTVASLYRRSLNVEALKKICRAVDVPVTVAGGITSVNEVRDALHAGADKVAINTGAVANPDLIGEVAKLFGSQCIVGSVDYYTQSEWEKYYFKGAELDKLLQIGVDRGLFTKQEANDQTLDWYRATSPEIIEKKKLEMHWHSYYRSWIPQENYYYTAQYTNYRTNNCGRSEGTYIKYASLDDRSDGFHFYLSYMKFGLGRASRDAMKVIRMNHITREEAVTLVRRFDHEFPSRHFHWFLDYLDIAEDHFWAVMDMYRELSNVWLKEKGVWTMTAVVS